VSGLVRCRALKQFRTYLLAALLLTVALGSAAAQTLSMNSGPDFGTSSIGDLQAELDASGGNGSYSWSVIAGALPPGMLLRTDGAPFFSSNASAGIIGVATTPGTYAFTLSVSSAGQTVTRACTIKITRLHMQDIYQQQDAFIGIFYSHRFTSLNNAGIVTYTALNGLPPGMTLAGDGTLSGTPTQSGFYNINIRMTDGVDTVFITRALPVFDVQITTDGTLPNTTQDAPYNAAITASGGTPPYTFTSTGMPGNLVLSSSGIISGSLSFGPSHYQFDVTATDANHLSYTRRMSVDVVGKPPQLPRVSPYGAIQALDDCVLGNDCADAISVNLGGTAPFTWTASGLPQGMAIRFGSGVTTWYLTPGDGEIYGRASQLGDFSVTVTVTDATGATSTDTFPLHVSEIFQHYNDRIPQGTFGVPYSFKIRAIGGTGSYSFTNLDDQLPNGLGFDFNNFLLSGTPNEAGNFNAMLRFKDSAAHAFTQQNFFTIAFPSNGTQTININDSADLGTVTAGTFYSRQLGACCAPSYVWTQSSGTLPPGISLSSSGLLSGTSSVVGVYNFATQVADTGNRANYAVRYFKLTVSPIQNTSQYLLPPGNVGTSYSFTFAATGGTGSLGWSLPAGEHLPPGISLSANGTLSGAPTASGQYQGFVYVTDQAGHFTQVFYDLSIYPAGQNPPLNFTFGPDLGQRTPGRFYQSLQGTGGTPPYHFSLTPGANVVAGMRVQDGQPLPQWFASDVTGAYIGVITTPGSYSTSLRVTDSVGNIFDRDIHFTIGGPGYAGPSSLAFAKVNTPYAYLLTAVGGSGNYRFDDNGGLAPGLKLDPSGLLSGSPTTPGLYNFNFIVTDLTTSERSFFYNVQVEVNAFSITTGGVLPAGTVGTPYNLQFTAPGCGGGCTWSLFGGLPGNVSMSSSGLLSGTPSFSNNFHFTVQANGSAGTVQQNFSWPVSTSPPQPLSIQMDSEFGSIAYFDANNAALTTQGGTPPYSWAVTSGSLPTGFTLQGNADTIASFYYPGQSILVGRALALGTFHFTLQVTDANNNVASQAFTFNVSRIGIEFSNLQFVYNTASSQPLLVIGGDGNYSWTNIDALPRGLGVSANGLVGGTPGVTGQYFERMQVTDGTEYARNYLGFNIVSGTAATLTFNSGPNLGTFQQGNFQHIFLNPAGGTGPYTISVLSPLPPGFLLLTDANEPIVGATAGNFVLAGLGMTAGTFSFSLQVQDSQGNVGARAFSLTIPPFVLLNNTTLVDGSVGVPYSVPLVELDNSGTPVWAQVPNSPLPPGLSLSPAGLISGTPSQAGQFTFQLNATDGGIIRGYTFTVRISSLAISDLEVLPDGTVGVSYTYSFAGAGTPGITWSALGLPSGLQISPGGVITGTPQGVTRASVSVTASSATDRVQKRFALYVALPNPSELTLPGTSLPDALLGQNYQTQLVPTGGTPPYTLTLAAGSTLPPGLSLYSGTLLQSVQNTRIPAATVLAGVPTTVGQSIFDLVLTDAVGRQTKGTFTLNVASLSVFPVTVSNGTAGTPYVQQFSVVGGSAPYTFSVTPIDLFTRMLPAGFGVSPTGLLSGMSSDTGFFAFVLHVQDAAGQTFSRPYSFDVQNQNGLEAYGGPLPDISVGNPAIDALFTNGSSTYTWSVVSGSLPPGTHLQEDEALLGPNTWGLLGAVTTPGTYTFTVRATDNANASNFADESLTLRVVPFQRVSPTFSEISTRQLPVATIGQLYSFLFKFAGGKAPYTVSESTLYPLPSGLQLSSDGVLSGTPQVTGTFMIVPVVTDAQGFTANMVPLRLVITPAGVAPLVSVCCYDSSFFLLSGPFDDASVGVPYHFNLDEYLQGGVPPYTWSVTPGSSLPPGMALVLGSNGVPNYLGGIPTVPGNYNIQLTAQDSGGQSLTLTLSGPVTVLSLSPDSLPPAIAGTSYSVSIVPSGGTAPYSLQLQPYSALPSGLSLSSSGVLSGIPNYPGYFKVYVALSDSTGNTLNKAYQITVDTAAGDSPAVSLSPKPIQIVYTLGSPSPVTVPVTIGTTSGAYAFTLAESGLPSATLSANAGTTPASVNLSLNTAGLGAGIYSGVIGVAAAQTVNQFDTVPVLLTVVPPQPCTFALSPSSTAIGITGGTSSFGISTGPSCSWTANVSDSSFISISTGCPLGRVCPTYSGSGSGSLVYKIAANPGSTRTGTIAVNGTLFHITQFGTGGCAFAISPSSLPVSAAGGTVPVAVSTSDQSCSWTASGLGANATSVTGNGTVTLTIPPNPTASTVVLTASVAGQVFTATETGANCAVSLSAFDASWPANGGSGAVAVNTVAGCSYSTVTGPSWITVTSGGTGIGPGTLLYKVDPNSTTQPRSGALTIGGQIFQINEQALACSVSVDTSQLGSPLGSGGWFGVIGVTANGSNCSWSAQPTDSWITIAPATGTGTGTIGVTIGSNASSTTTRSSSIAISGQSVNVSQSGTSCSYALQSANGNVPAVGGTGLVGVIAPAACTWSSSTNDPSWLTISSSGTAGNSDVQFVAQRNTNSTPRTASLTIAGLTYTASQDAAPCTYTLGSKSINIAASGLVSGSFAFSTTASGCSPNAVSYSNWIGASTSFSGTAGTVTFNVTQNFSGMNRQGTIQLGDQGFTVTENAAACAYSLNAYGEVFSQSGGHDQVLGSPNALGCALPPTGTDQPSFITLEQLTGPANNIFTQPFEIAPFNSLVPNLRFGNITLGGQIFAIKQTSW
jgi:hypothetical protein